MKLRKFNIMLILALCLSIVPVSAFASPNTVTINNISAIKQGESVTISGTASLEEVIIQVVRPNQASTLYYDILTVLDGKFETKITIASKEAAGTYSVIVGQGSLLATANFVVAQSETVVPGGPSTPTGPIGSIVVPSTNGNPVTPQQGNYFVVNADTSSNTVASSKDANGAERDVVTQDNAALAKALAEAASPNHNKDPMVAISYNSNAGKGVTFELSASVLVAAAANAPNTVISLQTNEGQYSLPINLIDYKAIADSLGTTVDQLTIQISLSTAANDIDAKIKAAASKINAAQVGTAMDFTITVLGNNKSIVVNQFGSTYVDRTIRSVLPSNAGTPTVVRFDEITGALSFVPAVFNQQPDGSFKAAFKRNGNSIYAILTSSKTFTDVSSHWAKSDIELLASKQVISGVTADTFAPNKSITRAELAALLVRSLGLTTSGADTSFTDVASTDWYADTVSAAIHANLITGFTDHTFKPNDTITREQMAVMIARAIQFVKGTEASAVSSEQLTKFSDNASISGWAKDAVAQAVEAGIITGMEDGSFGPSAEATRAQAAVMLKRLLEYCEFIN